MSTCAAPPSCRMRAQAPYSCRVRRQTHRSWGWSPPDPIPAAPEAVAGHHGRARRQRSTDRSGLVAMLPAQGAARLLSCQSAPAAPTSAPNRRCRHDRAQFRAFVALAQRLAVLVGRQRLPALALGAGIGGREVCLLAAIVAEPCAKAAAPEKANSKPAGQHRDIKMGRCRRWETAREGAIGALAQLISVPKTSNDRSLRRAASKSALTAFAHRQPCATARIAASSGAYARLSVNRGRP